MFSLAVLKRTIKTNGLLWVLMSVILTLILISTSLVSSANARIGPMMILQFYTVFANLFPLIFIAIVGNKLIAAQVANGSLSYVLSGKIKRQQFVATQALFFIGSLLVMFGILTVTGLIISASSTSSLELNQVLLLNLGSFLLSLALSAISFFASCLFNTNGASLGLGAGLPVFFLLMSNLDNLSAVNENLKFAHYLTLNSLFSLTDILAYSTNLIWEFLILFAIAVLGYVCGMIVFRKKDLPL